MPQHHPKNPAPDEISTEVDKPEPEPVDKGGHLWLGAVVPKRHARRSVTRTLVKRQIREAFRRHQASLPPGLWLVRLRRVLAPAEFPSARSEALAEATRRELDDLLSRATMPGPGRPRPRAGVAQHR